MNPNAPVREIMTTNLITVRPSDTAQKIQSIFDTYSFHHLPVVEPGNIIKGIISKQDFLKITALFSPVINGKAERKNDSIFLTAGQIMTPYPTCLDPDDSIGLAADIFLSNLYHCLPIVEGNQLVGLVTSHDLLAYGFENVLEQ